MPLLLTSNLAYDCTICDMGVVNCENYAGGYDNAYIYNSLYQHRHDSAYDTYQQQHNFDQGVYANDIIIWAG